MQYYTKENVELNVTNSGQSWTETSWKRGGMRRADTGTAVFKKKTYCR